MKLSALLLILLACCIYSCSGSMEHTTPTPILPAEISFSRTTLDGESLTADTKALFNATGAIQMENVVLTYNGTHWSGTDLPRWEDDKENAILTAIHPVYEKAEYTTANLYDNTQLTDVLIAKDTLTENQEIKLQFNHLFAKLTIKTSSSIQSKLDEIQLTVPQAIESINPQNGEITSKVESHTYTSRADESGTYSFILPPMTEATLTLTTIADGKTYTNQLPAYTFRSGVEYTCKLREKGGICSVQDLIDFSQLINGKTVKGRTLEEFYNVIDEDTVIFLENDLTLNADSSKLILPIGYHNTKGFRHTFDGQGHTISGLVVPDRTTNSSVYNSYSGLFGYITEDGIVRNLTISGASNVKNATATIVGVLAAESKGLILNCNILSSALKATETETRMGFICSYSTGSIINCRVENCTLSTKTNCQSGALAGYATGTILNCRSFKNDYKNTGKTDSYTGGIVGMSNSTIPLDIVNCFIYTETTGLSNFGSVIGFARKGTITNAFYNKLTSRFHTENTVNTNVKVYSEGFTHEGTSIIDYYNDWIETTGKANYPDITFKRWVIPEGKYPKFDE